MLRLKIGGSVPATLPVPSVGLAPEAVRPGAAYMAAGGSIETAAEIAGPDSTETMGLVVAERSM